MSSTQEVYQAIEGPGVIAILIGKGMRLLGEYDVFVRTMERWDSRLPGDGSTVLGDEFSYDDLFSSLACFFEAHQWQDRKHSS